MCDNGWSLYDAQVVCRQLGYSGGTALSGAVYGQGNGTIWLNYVRCGGTESAIERCSHAGWGATNNCDHSEDASVICRESTTITTTTTTTITTATRRGMLIPYKQLKYNFG